jgi:hypothetical protein
MGVQKYSTKQMFKNLHLGFLLHFGMIGRLDQTSNNTLLHATTSLWGLPSYLFDVTVYKQTNKPKA